jgi:hypothetical protein
MFWHVRRAQWKRLGAAMTETGTNDVLFVPLVRLFLFEFFCIYLLMIFILFRFYLPFDAHGGLRWMCIWYACTCVFHFYFLTSYFILCQSCIWKLSRYWILTISILVLITTTSNGDDCRYWSSCWRKCAGGVGSGWCGLVSILLTIICYSFDASVIQFWGIYYSLKLGT